MLNIDVQSVVESEIRELLTEVDDEAVEMTPEDELVELGLSSLMLARLIIQLELALGTDPFADEVAVISDVRSVGELVNVYERALADAPEGVR
jgi:acyl carrier protein